MLNVTIPFAARYHTGRFLLITESGNALAISPKGNISEVNPGDAGRWIWWSISQIEDAVERAKADYHVINVVANPVGPKA